MSVQHGTVESIRNAHARETHPSQTRIEWADSDLHRGARDDDNAVDGLLVLRVTYADNNGSPNMRSADYAMITDADDAAIRDAKDISRHEGIYAVQVYAATPDGILTSGIPLAQFADGMGELL